MISEKEFREYCSARACTNKCNFFLDCIEFHKYISGISPIGRFVGATERYKFLVSYWRKQKLAKLLSQ